MLATLPKKGPTVNGPYSQWGRRAGDPCDFDQMREISADPIGHAVVEASAGGCEIDPEGGGGVSSCMAAFMMCESCVYFCCGPTRLPVVTSMLMLLVHVLILYIDMYMHSPL